MDLVTRQLMPPATRRKELLASINTDVTTCNRLTSVRLNHCSRLKDASLEEVLTYLNTRRIDLFYKSHNIQRKFDKQFVKLI